jgi:putative transposase
MDAEDETQGRRDRFEASPGRRFSGSGKQGCRRSSLDRRVAADVLPLAAYRCRREFGGLQLDQVKRLKELELENQRLRKAVSDLTLDKLILAEAAKGNY